MRLLITGSRNLTDSLRVVDAIHNVCRDYKTLPQIVVGDCPTGADQFAREWAEYNFLEPEVYVADWDKHGKAAGPKRNQAMVDSGANLCLAFPEGDSRGTRDCIRRALVAGIPTIIYEERQ